MHDSVELNQIYFLNQPSLIAMLDGEEESDEEFMKRSWLAMPVELLANDLIRTKEFSLGSQKFSFQKRPVETFRGMSSISDKNSDGLWLELKRWAINNNCKVEMSREIFDDMEE